MFNFRRNKTTPVVSISLNKTSTIITVGSSEILIATVLPTNATNKDVNWRSSNTRIATVNRYGKVIGMNSGTVKITATSSNGKVSTCVVTVKAIENTSTSSNVTNNTSTIPTNSTSNTTNVNSTTISTSTKSIYSDGFEGNIASFWEKEYANTSYSATISNKYVKSGNSSLRIEVRKTDPDVSGSKRSELAMSKNEKPNEEHTYSIDIYLPNGGDEDYTVDKGSVESIWQWHNLPDESLGEGWISPPLAMLTCPDGHYHLWRRWDEKQVSTNSSTGYEDIDLGSFVDDKGKWVNWKFHIKWGWLASQNPKFEIYKNNVLICERNGKPNMTNDKNGVYMKVGVYKWEWKDGNSSSLSKRVIYFDNVSVQ